MKTIQEWVTAHGIKSLENRKIKTYKGIAVIHPQCLQEDIDLYQGSTFAEQAKLKRFYGYLHNGNPNRCFWIYRSDYVV